MLDRSTTRRPRFRTARRARGLLLLVFLPALAWPASRAAADPLSEREAWIFSRTCAHCHARPGLGVPVVGDDAAWAPRREKGLEALVENVVLGIGDMPPLGTCGFCTERDLRSIVVFLARLSDAPEAGPAE